MADAKITFPLTEIMDLSLAYHSLELMAAADTDNDPAPVLKVLNDRFDLLIESMRMQIEIQKSGTPH